MEEAAAIEQAFHVMTVVPNQANDMMDIGRLQGFEVDIINILLWYNHGKYLFAAVFTWLKNSNVLIQTFFQG